MIDRRAESQRATECRQHVSYEPEIKQADTFSGDRQWHAWTDKQARLYLTEIVFHLREVGQGLDLQG